MSKETVFLEVRGLCKSYGVDEVRVEVLKSINVSLNKGEVCVLLGPSGSGKSTFLNIVGGLEPADMGSIRVGDTTITDLSASDMVEYRHPPRERVNLVTHGIASPKASPA